MSTRLAMTQQEKYIGIAAMASSFAFGHAVAMFLGRGVGLSLGMVSMAIALLIYFYLNKHGESLEFPVLVKMRRLVATLLMPSAGAIGTFNNSMIDAGLLLAALGVSLIFFRLVKNRGEA